MKIIYKAINFYDNLTVKRPIFTLSVAILIISFFSLSINDFKMDASADSLVLENDQALKFYRSTSARYSTEDFVVITYKPKNGIYNSDSLKILDTLASDLKIALKE